VQWVVKDCGGGRQWSFESDWRCSYSSPSVGVGTLSTQARLLSWGARGFSRSACSLPDAQSARQRAHLQDSGKSVQELVSVVMRAVCNKRIYQSDSYGSPISKKQKKSEMFSPADLEYQMASNDLTSERLIRKAQSRGINATKIAPSKFEATKTPSGLSFFLKTGISEVLAPRNTSLDKKNLRNSTSKTLRQTNSSKFIRLLNPVNPSIVKGSTPGLLRKQSSQALGLNSAAELAASSSNLSAFLKKCASNYLASKFQN
jgi:hypothetical protein